ncbi:MAG: MFS transporter [Pseudonocardia sp. SCN 72-86]|nr:MAG: MFS transporter [Pseudonocardia sp. SCN 72-86]
MRLWMDPSPLRDRGFRAVFVGRTIAVFGLGFVLVAVPLQVYTLTGSTAGVAAVTATVGIAAFAGTLAGGVLADRHDRRVVIVAARAAAGLGYAGLTVNAFAPDPAMWAIYTCGVVDGVAGGISSTALMAATPNLVPREKLAAAGALMQLMVTIGTVAAPALGGLLVATAGFGGNYAVCTATAVVTVGSLLRLPALPAGGTGRSGPRLVAAGFAFAVRDRHVGPVLAVGIVGMVTAGWTVLLPEFTTAVLGGGPGVVGLLYAAPAAGAMLGSLTSGWTGAVVRLGPVLLLTTLLACVGLAAAGATTSALVTGLALAAFGFGRAVCDVVRYTAVLESTPDALRGRVSAVWSAQLVVSAAVGAGVAGAVAGLLPVRWAVTGYGLVALAVLLLVAVVVPPVRALRRTAAGGVVGD